MLISLVSINLGARVKLGTLEASSESVWLLFGAAGVLIDALLGCIGNRSDGTRDLIQPDIAKVKDQPGFQAGAIGMYMMT